MDKISNFLILVLLLSGCNVSDSPKGEGPEPQVEEYFRAELNGEPWSGEPRAGFTIIKTDSLFQVFATRLDSVLYPNNNKISFSLFYKKAQTEYSVLRKSGSHNFQTGGFFTELAGDAIIGRYDPVPDSLNVLTINITKDEEGNKFVTGNFAMKVTIREVYDDKKPNNSYRQYPDTVRIMDGEFRVLLEEEK